MSSQLTNSMIFQMGRYTTNQSGNLFSQMKLGNTIKYANVRWLEWDVQDTKIGGWSIGNGIYPRVNVDIAVENPMAFRFHLENDLLKWWLVTSVLLFYGRVICCNPYADHGAGICTPTWLPHKWPSHVGKYTSTMEHMGNDMFDNV